ncbi:MAG TPA: hypothetical protein VIH89_11590 [Candidatus Sulfotelmatobacter sp.]
MFPRELKPEHFKAYPPEARKIVTDYISTLQNLPLTFVPNLLREAIEYDFKFPAERSALEKELANLRSLSAAQQRDWLQEFSQIALSSDLEQTDWVDSPAQFVERLSAHLWATHQLDAFRKAATDYADRLHAAVPPELPPIARLGIAVIGQAVSSYDEPLFRKLRPHGAYFSRVKSEGGLQLLLDAVADRAKKNPLAYGHWYVDGGEEAKHSPALTCVSYHALETVRAELLRRMRAQIEKPGMGPEALRTLLAQMNPAELGLNKTNDLVLDHFQMKLLTEGSGTQIFSTTFAQWTAREALRRAQPCTLLVRFAPRQRQKPMNELLSDKQDQVELDPLGSLIDADLGAYYNWINQQRLPGAEQSSFLAWFENHSEAVAIGPAMPRGTESAKPADLRELLSWMT